MRRITGIVVALLMIASLAIAQKPTGYNLSKGDIFTITTNIKQDIQQEVMGQTMTTDQTISNTDEMEVMASEGGVYTIKVTGIRRAISLQSPMGSTDIDSDKEGDEHIALRIMNGKSYTIKVNRFGKVLEVEGVDKMRTAMGEEFTNAGLGVVKDQMLANYSDELMKSGMETMLGVYSDGNETEWTVKTSSVVNNLPVELENAFKWDDDKTILAEAKIDISGEIEAMGTAMKTAMKGDQQSIIDLDVKSGMPTKIQTIQTVDGNIEAQGMTIPMSIVSETSTTIVKK